MRKYVHFANWIEPKDERIITELYTGELSGISPLPINVFMAYLRSRVHAEWCTSPEEGEKRDGEGQRIWYHSYSTNCGAFEKWVNDETLFSLERTHSADYQGTRRKVLKAVVEIAADLFNSWNLEWSPPYDVSAGTCPDKTNLRRDLKNYLGE